MLVVFSKELESQGIEHKTATSFFFQGNLFERGVAFSNRLYELAVETCQKELAAGGFCLLVDNETHLTIWRQKLLPNRSEPTAAPETIPEKDSYQAAESTADSTLFTYRGNVYRAPSAQPQRSSNQAPAQKKSVRKYRGVNY
ncbi:MAG: hypothetical protein QNJ46_33450 [Leptolyngbyaceae cyanobacterium MO_188.B28]|nr:hypothetical protein [Leptolyngbyaceae cyanobacterium MO_188.B28]